MREHRSTAASWDAEYAAGRYLSEPPVPFVHDILSAARAHGVRTGLYVGCGNGRNFVPLIGIQVFQHGDRTTAWANVRAAQQRTAAGGLFCLRVNAVGTDVWPAHEVTGRDRDGGFTVRYLAGPKRGLHIHFFSAAELGNLFGSGFTPVIPPRLRSVGRAAPAPGQWSQWEAIWRKTR